MPSKDSWPIGRPAPGRRVGSHRRRHRAGARRLRVESLEDRRLLASEPILSAGGLAGEPLAAIHGTKWHDLNANGVKDLGEPGLPGWTIFLDQNLSGTLDAGEPWTTTDANGNYAFEQLAAGTYEVAEVSSDAWSVTSPVATGLSSAPNPAPAAPAAAASSPAAALPGATSITLVDAGIGLSASAGPEPAAPAAGADDHLTWSQPDCLMPPSQASSLLDASYTASPVPAGSPPPAGKAPYGATGDDLSEFMIGDVWVTVVLMESNGTRDPQTENWTPAQITQVKSEIQEGLKWWEDTFNSAPAVRPLDHLRFHVDFTYADSPAATGYEPISRPQYDEGKWIDDFLGQVGYHSTAGYFTDVGRWDQAQRLAHNTDWAFTVFVVNSLADADGTFSDGYFAYAYLGGPFTVMTYDNDGWGISRMGQVLAHETGHVFFALDEYPGSNRYTDRSGYYNTQNLNASDGNPNPGGRVASLMAEASLQGTAYANHSSSPTSLQMLGWQDSDADGVLDVLDVPLTLTGTGSYDPLTGRYGFTGSSAVGTLANQNPNSFQHAITTNTVDRIQSRLDGGPWIDGNAYGDYSATVGQQVRLGTGRHTVEFRTVDAENAMSSPVWSDAVRVGVQTVAVADGQVVQDVNFGNYRLPMAAADAYATGENQLLSVAAPGVLANDAGNAIAAALVLGTTHGTLRLESDGSFTYRPAPGYFGEDPFTYKVTDGHSESAPATVTITVNATPPENVVPPAQTVLDDAVLVFSSAGGNAISVTDPGGGDTLQVALTATHGTLTLGGTAGLSFSEGDGSDDAAMTFGGKLSAINAALEGLAYRPTLYYAGAASVQIVSSDGPASDTDAVDVTVSLDPRVLGRHVFYNNSKFDGNDPAATAADDAAIAPDKAALLPGGTATFANYVSFSRGLNGIMIDLLGLPASTLEPADFSLRYGNNGTPGGWTTAPDPRAIAIRPGAGPHGSDRITLLWPDRAIPNTNWLQVTVRAGARTGLASADVFYFGGAIGETGNSTADARVNSSDVTLMRLNYSGFGTVPIGSRYDLNRDGKVNSADVTICRNYFSGFTPLELIAAPASGGTAAAAPAPQPSALTDAAFGAGTPFWAGRAYLELAWLDQVRLPKAKGNGFGPDEAAAGAADRVRTGGAA